MGTIPDMFSGYLDIGDDKYTFSVENHRVTLIPACSDPNEQYSAIARLEEHNKGVSEFFFGQSNLYKIAF